MRLIEDILNFRTDVSPFLVHLTRKSDTMLAKDCLRSIISGKKLKASSAYNSLASYGLPFSQLKKPEVGIYFQSVCFTETPLNEIHCLLNIKKSSVNLEPYGLIFIRKRLQEKGVSPAIYLNNELGDKPSLIKNLVKLITENPEIASQILPFINVFGKKIPAQCKGNPPDGRVDFLWEREWRWPKLKGDFNFEESDIFIGVCPDEEIDEFENEFKGMYFVDPRRNMRWYSRQLIEMRKKLGLTQSVL